MDFVGVCLDPILNQAAKLRYMTAGALCRSRSSSARRPGAGRSAGAQHSQSLEAWFAHVPGPEGGDAGDGRPTLTTCWSTSVRDPNPVVFVENRRLYGMRGDARATTPLPLGKARVARAGDGVTVVTWGQMLRDCLAAAEERPRLARGGRPALAGAARHGDGGRVGAQDRPPADRPRGRAGLRRGRRDRGPRSRDELFDELRTPGAPPGRAVGADAVQPGARDARCFRAPSRSAAAAKALMAEG